MQRERGAITDPNQKSNAEVEKKSKESVPHLPAADLQTETVKLFSDADTVNETLPIAQAPAAIEKLLNGWLKKVSTVGDHEIVDVLYRFAAQNSKLKPTHFDLIDKILARRSLLLLNVQAVTLAELSKRLDGKTDFDALSIGKNELQQTLQLIAQNETRCSTDSDDGFHSPLTWPWLEQLEQAAGDQRYVVETLFWNKEFVSADYFRQQLKLANRTQSELTSNRSRLDYAFATLDQGRRLLPQFLPMIDGSPYEFGAWKEAVDLCNRIESTLIVQTQATNQRVEVERTNSALHDLDATFADSQDLKRKLDQLMLRFTQNEIDGLVTESKRSATIQNLRRIEDDPRHSVC